jgi:hypothetical protein
MDRFFLIIATDIDGTEIKETLCRRNMDTAVSDFKVMHPDCRIWAVNEV